MSGAEPGTARPERDRFIDFVRVASMLAVVVLHWLSVLPQLRSGVVVDRNVVEAQPWLWPLTWTGDVMALFFFAGGYANWVSLAAGRDRGEGVTDYLVRRYRRLIVPTLQFFGAWLALDLLFRFSGHGGLSPLRHVATGNTIPFGPLWFLGVYVVVVALAPWTAAAHRRWGFRIVVVMVLGVLVSDALAFHLDRGTPLALNLVLVWLVPHQLGFFYADGSLRRLGPAACAALAVGGVAALAVLTSTPYYPRSLITPRWTVLSLDAPTLSLVAAAAWLIGLALLVRPWVERALADPGRWRQVGRANDLALPVYLWHMTAYLVAASFLARLGAGFVYADTPTTAWWWGRIAVVLTSAAVLAGILWLVHRFTPRAPS